MRVRVNELIEKVRASLFFVPMLAVVLAVALGQASVTVDKELDGATDLPFVFTSTVESARSVLSTVAGATMTFAGIAFSVSLLVIQLGSGQYSPRVVHTLFRDPFNRRVMALVVGTFTYCLIVLRTVRSALESTGEPVIPNISVAIAVVLGIATILTIVGFISHSAHSMDISKILQQVTTEAINAVRAEWPDANERSDDPDPSVDAVVTSVAGYESYEVRFQRNGWVQQVDAQAFLECTPPGGVLRLHAHPGRYAIAGTVLCEVAPPPDDTEKFEKSIGAAVGIGETRTMQQDVSYGLRQLVDVTLRSLSPGINDPTTAQDAIFHAGAVLAEMLTRDLPPNVWSDDDGRRLVFHHGPTHREMVDLAFDEVRRAAAPHPTVCVYLLESLCDVYEAVAAAGFEDRLEPLIHQAQLVVEGADAADVLAADRDLVRVTYDKRFGHRSPTAAGDVPPP